MGAVHIASTFLLIARSVAVSTHSCEALPDSTELSPTGKSISEYLLLSKI